MSFRSNQRKKKRANSQRKVVFKCAGLKNDPIMNVGEKHNNEEYSKERSKENVKYTAESSNLTKFSTNLSQHPNNNQGIIAGVITIIWSYIKCAFSIIRSSFNWLTLKHHRAISNFPSVSDENNFCDNDTRSKRFKDLVEFYQNHPTFPISQRGLNDIEESLYESDYSTHDEDNFICDPSHSQEHSQNLIHSFADQVEKENQERQELDKSKEILQAESTVYEKQKVQTDVKIDEDKEVNKEIGEKNQIKKLEIKEEKVEEEKVEEEKVEEEKVEEEKVEEEKVEEEKVEEEKVEEEKVEEEKVEEEKVEEEKVEEEKVEEEKVEEEKVEEEKVEEEKQVFAQITQYSLDRKIKTFSNYFKFLPQKDFQNKMIFSILNDDSHKLFGEHGIPSDQFVLLYQLDLNGFVKTKLFQCEKFNRVRFCLGPSLYGRRISLFTNYNPDHSLFNRKTYHPVSIEDDSNTLQLSCSGSFHFYYTDVQHKEVAVGSFYIVVKPELSINNGKNILSVNAIQCQTVLSKLMGPLSTWQDKLNVSIQSGYNMIHWTPIQELGGSKSAYSLKDQHNVNPSFSEKDSKPCVLDQVGEFVEQLRNDHGVLSITDIVLNHTANETPWLETHPEAAYNCSNSPWLRPAFLLDSILWHLSLDIIDGRWATRGITDCIDQEYQLDIIKNIFVEEYLPLVKIEQLFLCNESELLENFENYLLRYIFGDVGAKREDLDSFSIKQYPSAPSLECDPIILLCDSEYRRFQAKIDFANMLLNVFDKVPFIGNFDDRAALARWIDFALLFVEEKLKVLNQQKKEEIENHLHNAVENVIRGARYERIDNNGPKIKKITKIHPLATRYFTDSSRHHRDLIQIQESIYDHSKASFYMAHNGWVMGDDPLRNFADESSLVYLRRELICWGDSVKLRYGKKLSDSPFLWQYMEEYVRLMAKTFHGLRLDNCHSTPIHVAQYVIDAARRVNPDLYLVAELFTSSEDVDNIFVNKLGIISLIRESLSASTPFELGRQVYRFGGEPVGSFLPNEVKIAGRKLTNPLFLRPFTSSVAHAIFFDQTHDNESPIKKTTVYNLIPLSALVSMTYSAIGSNRGFDELVPHHIHVVNEDREYGHWLTNVQPEDGIIKAKALLNKLHQMLSKNNFSQAFVDQRDRDFVVLTRHNPSNHKSVILMARTAFYPLDCGYENHIRPLNIEGKFEKILFEMRMIKNDKESDQEFKKDEHFINGLKNVKCYLNTEIDSTNTEMIDILINDNSNEIQFRNFVPSSVIALVMGLTLKQNDSLKSIESRILEINDPQSKLSKIIYDFDLLDLNYILFRCEQEEKDESGHGCYSLSNGTFVYAGLAGMMYSLSKIRTNNDLGHPLCVNLRDGNWLTSYIVDRLKQRSSTLKLAEWLCSVFDNLNLLPRYLVPQYFDSIMLPLYTKLLDHTFSLQSDFIKSGDDFIQRLALGGVALIGSHKSSPLPSLAYESIPEAFKEKKLSQEELPTLAAGLPHFSSGYMRNWGRDTFISLKGLLLLTGRYDEAKIIILGFAGAMRHGLIPNLLDAGRNSRFNCRDAVWWWLQAIKDYVTIVPEGEKILQAKVLRVFNKNKIEMLQDTMIEALQAHFNGIDFIEENAGTAIDAHMTAEGFHLKIGVNRDNGFVYGGNRWNCGTWMDKMGSSDNARNRGYPATPRDGAAVEIVGLSASILIFLSNLHKAGKFPVSGVFTQVEKWSFEEWFNKIQANFEKYFFVSDDCQSSVKNRSDIYRDTVGATDEWRDYQLRPNFLVTMVVAPELFDRSNALKAIKIVEETLQGPFGMKTLDPSDWNYRPDYDNSNQSCDSTVANGFNYHNGPEWLWPTGFYLQARLKFITDHEDEIVRIDHWISEHYKHLVNSDWFGLPELTNSNGSYCRDSCPIQAWSHATLLELLYLKSILQRCFI